MMMVKHGKMLLLASAMSALQALPSFALNSDTMKEATDLLNSSLPQICSEFTHSGSSESMVVSGDATAKLNNLLKKLADFGVKGTGEIKSEQYVGVPQTQLADQLNQTRACRKDLFDKIFPIIEKSFHESSSDGHSCVVYNFGGVIVGSPCSVSSFSSKVDDDKTAGNAIIAQPVASIQQEVASKSVVPAPPEIAKQPMASAQLFVPAQPEVAIWPTLPEFGPVAKMSPTRSGQVASIEPRENISLKPPAVVRPDPEKQVEPKKNSRSQSGSAASRQVKTVRAGVYPVDCSRGHPRRICDAYIAFVR